MGRQAIPGNIGREASRMKTTEIISIGGKQAVTLPDDYRFAGDTVSIRKEGDAVILEPVRAENWPQGFFESIRISDSAFARPCQPELPMAPSIDSE